jgi:hypothetical protein
MKYTLFFLLASVLMAQEIPKGVAPAVALESQTKSIIVIDPKARASDYAQVFEFLRKDKPTQRITVRTADAMLMGVTDITPSTGGTLLIIKAQSSQGLKIQVIPVEQIVEISYSP